MDKRKPEREKRDTIVATRKREHQIRRFEDHYCKKHDFYFCPLDYDHTPHNRTDY